jgi:hypothetical protein
MWIRYQQRVDKVPEKALAVQGKASDMKTFFFGGGQLFSTSVVDVATRSLCVCGFGVSFERPQLPRVCWHRVVARIRSA